MLVLAPAAVSHSRAETYGSSQAKVIVHSDQGQFSLPNGDSPLGKSLSFKCKAAHGCLLTVGAFVQAEDTAVCTFVDGVEAIPNCIVNRTDPQVNARQNAHVGTGTHTIQTIVRCDDQSCNMLGWEVDYTFYD
jgi:hypothetical protein